MLEIQHFHAVNQAERTKGSVAKIKRRQGDPIHPIDKIDHAVELLQDTITHVKALIDANLAMRKTIKASAYKPRNEDNGPQEEKD